MKYPSFVFALFVIFIKVTNQSSAFVVVQIM